MSYQYKIRRESYRVITITDNDILRRLPHDSELLEASARRVKNEVEIYRRTYKNTVFDLVYCDGADWHIDWEEVFDQIILIDCVLKIGFNNKYNLGYDSYIPSDVKLIQNIELKRGDVLQIYPMIPHSVVGEYMAIEATDQNAVNEHDQPYFRPISKMMQCVDRILPKVA